MCSQLDVDVQSTDLLVWTVTSNSLQKWADSFTKHVLERNVQLSDWLLRTDSRNSLQRWAHSWTTLNADVPNKWLSAEYGQNRRSNWYAVSLICAHSLNMMYTSERDMFGLSHAAVHWTWCTAQKMIFADCSWQELTAEPLQYVLVQWNRRSDWYSKLMRTSKILVLDRVQQRSAAMSSQLK